MKKFNSDEIKNDIEMGPYLPSEFNGKQLDKDDLIRYYDYMRKEIEREDKLSYDRTVTTLSLQGFLVTAIALMSGPAGGNISPSFDRLVMMLLVSLSGISLSFFSLKGISASRDSLSWAKGEWVTFNRKNGYLYPNLLPQLTRRSNETMSNAIDRLGKDQGYFMEKLKLIFKIKEDYVAGSNKYYEKIKRHRMILKIDAGSIYFQSIPFVMIIFWISALIVISMRIFYNIISYLFL